MRLLFVTGMFRSGTTLLGRMLNAHPQLAVASDPYMPFFKSFRSTVAACLGQDIPAAAPLDDYYFRHEAIELFRAIQDASLDVALDRPALDNLKTAVATHAEPYSPLILPLVESIRGSSYRDVLDQMIGVLQSCYGKRTMDYLGFKEVWTDEFIPVLARALPEARFIQIVRDPRAVAASKNATDEQYPWLFLGRQWRKLAGLAHDYAADPHFGRRVCVVRYEDLVESPEESMHAICRFLEVDPRGEMIDPRRYVDGAGNPWSQNSSFAGKGQAFDKDGIHRWREILRPDEQAYLDMLCGPEMTLHRYSRSKTNLTEAPVVGIPRLEDERLADWIRGLFPNDALSLSVQSQVEGLRSRLLAMPSSELIDRDVVEGCFLKEQIFRSARDGMRENRSHAGELGE